MLTRSGWGALLLAAIAFVVGRVFGLIELYVLGVGLVAAVGVPVATMMATPPRLAVRRLIDPSTTDGPVDVDSASYFLSKLELCAGDKPTMAAWRKRLFIATSYITADAARYFQLPLERTVIIGERIEF